MGEFLATLFLTRELAHRYHLNTKSYAQHVALGAFYETLEDQVDGLAELLQGKEGILDIPIMNAKVKKEEPVYCLLEKLSYVENTRYKFFGKDDTPVQNLIDGIVENFLSTIYKLENLK